MTPEVENVAVGVHGSVYQAGTMYLGRVGAPAVDDAVRDDRALIADVLRDGFTGRAWLLARIEAFLRDRRCGYLWIEGDAGVGKTALAAYLVREREWVGHFARLPRGGTVRVGLANLAGRLARRFGLAETGMLPEQACTPDGFDTLLARAAERGPVVLVVDGADEAEVDGQPWGLPGHLPDGVHIIGTYRTGSPPPRCGAPREVIRLAADDDDNMDDLRAHLHSVLPADQADALADKCGGVWIYLRYVLAELRQGIRENIEDLPADLTVYYGATLDRWRADPRWDDLLPVLATLAVAREPLDAATLASLAGAGHTQTLDWCHTALRPFLSAQGTDTRAFEIYHASLREFLTGHTPSPDSPDAEWLWMETLRAATTTARHRIVDHYLRVVEHDDEPVPGYALRHLARHLVDADRVHDLHRLLALSRQDNNTWFTAHDEADTLDDYLQDVATALRDVQSRTDQALADGDPTVTLPDELRYHLVGSSLTSRAVAILPELLVALVEAGVWPPTRAVKHARRLAVNQRYRALTALLPYQDTVITDILDAADLVTGHHRAEAIAGVLPHLPEDERRPAAERAFAALAETTEDHRRVGPLCELLPYLDADRVEELAATMTTAARARVLVALVSRSADECGSVAEAVTAVSRVVDEGDRVRLLADLAPTAPAQVLAVAMKVGDPGYRVEALCAVLPYLPSVRAEPVAEAIRDAAPDALPTVRLVEALARGIRPSVDWRGLAVEMACRIEEDVDRVDAYRAVLPLLPDRERGRAVEVWCAYLDDLADRVRLVTAALPLVGESERDASVGRLSEWTALLGAADRAAALVSLAEHVPGYADLALADVKDLWHLPRRADLLVRLASSLSGESERIAVRAALSATTAIQTGGSLLALALARSDPAATGTGATRGHRALFDTNPHPTHAAVPVLLGDTDEAGVSTPCVDVEDVHTRVRAFAREAVLVPPGTRATVAAELFARLASAPDDDRRARSLAGLVPHLPSGHVERALALVLDSRADTARALARLVPALATAAQLAATLETLGPRDRDLRVLVVTRARDVVGSDADFLGVLRCSLWSVDRVECLHLLSIALPRLRALGGDEFDEDTRTAVHDVHRWWP
ncbi:hypothetical protein [Actinokineospora enzanensis]|uniref:hypothetical protein n=1 Tax=Actinokineospora enzanensis TaxID=155975 RepID=UPI00037B35E4|nr:hypothetical protein [Actinokineospora enzanensis]